MDDPGTAELAAFALAAETAALARDVDGAEHLYKALALHSGRRIPSPRPGIALGHVAYYLGLLARIAGRLENATHHFEQALAAHVAAGEDAWAARVSCELARALLARGDDASHRKALTALDAVRTWAGANPELADEVVGLLARAERRPIGRTNVIRAQGESWMLAFDGDVVHIRDTKGLRWLSLLLRHPWQEFPVVTLESAGKQHVGLPERVDAAAAERARLRVTRAIHGALERVAARHPALGRHLASTVRTGRVCAYVPDPRVPIEWTD